MKKRRSEPDDRPAVEELGGESEYSLRAAHRDERGSTRRRRGARDEELSVDPDDLARHYIEGTKPEAALFDEEDEPLVENGDSET